MTSVDVAFSRLMLKEAHELVRRRDKEVDLRRAWVWHSGRNWEFHAPDGFYWHGRADNAYDARYKGWMAWLDKVEVVP